MSNQPENKLDPKVQERITQEREQKTGTLDLSYMGLTAIPAELKTMNWLQELNIYSNQIQKLENLPDTLTQFNISSNQIQKLENLPDTLTQLNISSNQIQKLENLPDTLISLLIYNNNIQTLENLPSKLKRLIIFNNELRKLENLPPNLTWLEVAGSKIQRIENLPNKLEVLEISRSEIKKLENLPESLTGLRAHSNRIKKLSNLPSSLKWLTITSNQIQKLENLPNNLTSLDLSSNQIQKLENLPVSLTSLDLSSNQIQKLENLPVSLIDLNISSNNITNLQNSWDQIVQTQLEIVSIKNDSFKARLIEKGDSLLSLYDNPLVIPPQNILEQGHQAIVDYMNQYFAENGKADYLFESKLLIVGESGAGKTTFARRLKDPNEDMPNREETTHGINVDKWEFEVGPGEFPDLNHKEAQFFVNLWDFGGQDIYHGTHQFFFSEKSLYVLLADTREEKADFSYWLNTVEQLTGEDSSLFILLNKRDGRIWQIDENGLRSRFNKILKEAKTVDLSDSDAIPDLQDQIKHWLRQLPEVGVPLIESWVRIREDLAKETRNSISFDRFREICRQRGVEKAEYIRNISRYFHRIGVITHFLEDEVLNNKVYLNSNWLTDTVYRILDSPVAIDNKGRLDLEQIRSVWSDEALEFETRTLLRLLDKFGLMYRTPNDTYIIPRHLPDEQPYVAWPQREQRPLLHFRYLFDKYMPKGLMSRLIVALHGYIPNHDQVWKRGVNLAYNGSQAEIVEQYGGINQFDIRIVGPFQRDLLVIITRAFDDMLQRYKNLKYRKEIKCPCTECSESKDPYFHSTAVIENALVKKYKKTNLTPTIECPRSFDDVPVKDLMALIDYEVVINNIRHSTQESSNDEIKLMLANLEMSMRREFAANMDKLDELPQLFKAELQDDLDHIMDQIQTIDFNTTQAENLLMEMQVLINQNLKMLPAAIQEKWKAAQEASMNVDLKGKFELVVPIIPSMLSYKMEIGTNFKGGFRAKLRELWRELRSGQVFRKAAE